MKKYGITILSIIGIMCLVTACSKQSPSSSGTMAAIINGTDTFRTDQVTVNTSTGGYMTIDGQVNNKHLYFSVYNYNNISETFPISQPTNPAYYAVYDTMRYYADTGVLVLTSTGPRSSLGTFYFRCTDSTVVSSGTMNIHW